MRIFKTILEIDIWRGEIDDARERVALVPTMGFLHDGHLELVREAHKRADQVVVSIFVNPTQFGANEDLAKYPRDFERDERLCREHGVDVVFYPDNNEMYAPDASTWVEETALSQPLCGESRPGHFRGVATVVAKLFNIVRPNVAVFGQKDAQQLLVIRRMIRDLNFPVSLVSRPIVREPDGLAMSSRNKYLTPDQRRCALSIHRGLQKAEHAFADGEGEVEKLIKLVKSEIVDSGGRIEYVRILKCDDLKPFNSGVVDKFALLAVAAFFGDTRLIDNTLLRPKDQIS